MAVIWDQVERQTATTTQIPRQRDQRLEARVTSSQKKLIERAARAQGRTVTEFVIATLQDASRRAIEESTVWKLSQDQQKAFVEALMGPPAPNAKLRAAYRRYEKLKALSGRRR
jgi:uncharacterized protein (DUF1778 family)